jgi:hypothetical protein
MSMPIDREAFDLAIDLTLLTPEHVSPQEGGKTRPILSGYRCTVDLADSHWVTAFYLQDRETLNPGETARALVQFSVPQLALEHLNRETILLLREGGRLVGRGRIVEFLSIEKNAAKYRQREEEWARQQEERRAANAAALARQQEERLTQLQAEEFVRQEKAAAAKRKRTALEKREKKHVRPTKKTSRGQPRPGTR